MRFVLVFVGQAIEGPSFGLASPHGPWLLRISSHGDGPSRLITTGSSFSISPLAGPERVDEGAATDGPFFRLGQTARLGFRGVGAPALRPSRRSAGLAFRGSRGPACVDARAGTLVPAVRLSLAVAQERSATFSAGVRPIA